MTRSRKTLFTLLTLLLTSSLLEGGARVIRHIREEPTATASGSGMLQRDEVLHHRWVPGVRLLDDTREVPYWLVTNRQGWVEEYDVEPHKPADSFRVFYVGDSNTQGVVEARHKMVQQVEDALKARYLDSETRIEVINAGTSSYSFLLYYLQIKNDILPYAPDLVVLNIDMTDVVNDYVYRKTAVVDDAGDILAVLPSAHIDTARYRMTPGGLVELHRFAPLQHWLVNHSAFCYYQDRALNHFRGTTHVDTRNQGMLDDRANWLAHDWSPRIERHVQRSMEVLVRTIHLLQSQGVRVMVTGVPHHPQYTGEWSARPHEALRRATEQAGALYLDSFAALRTEISGTPVERYYWASDPTHFNMAGNHIWAEAQSSFLEQHAETLLP